MQPVAIEYLKPQRRRYRSVLHRRDGLVVELDGGSDNTIGGPAGELPHDLAHLVVEDGLGLEASGARAARRRGADGPLATAAAALSRAPADGTSSRADRLDFFTASAGRPAKNVA